MRCNDKNNNNNFFIRKNKATAMGSEGVKDGAQKGLKDRAQKQLKMGQRMG